MARLPYPKAERRQSKGGQWGEQWSEQWSGQLCVMRGFLLKKRKGSLRDIFQSGCSRFSFF